MRVIILILFFTNSLFGQILQIGSIDDNGRVYFNSKIITLPDSVDQILLKYSENERAGTRYKFEVFEEKSIILKSYKFEVEITHTLDRCSNRVRSYSTYKIHFGKNINGDFLKKDSLSSFFDENTELMVYEDLLKEQLRFLYKKFALEYSLSTILKNIANGYVSTYDFESKRTKSIKFSDTLITVPVNTVRKLSSTEINLIKDIL